MPSYLTLDNNIIFQKDTIFLYELVNNNLFFGCSTDQLLRHTKKIVAAGCDIRRVVGVYRLKPGYTPILEHVLHNLLCADLSLLPDTTKNNKYSGYNYDRLLLSNFMLPSPIFRDYIPSNNLELDHINQIFDLYELLKPYQIKN